MVLIFASSILFLMTLFFLNPELFFRGEFLKKIQGLDKVRAGFGITLIFLGLCLGVYFVFHFITELKWLIVLTLSIFLIIIGTVSSSHFLSSILKNENLRDFFATMVDFYAGLKKIFPSNYLGYFFIFVGVFGIVASIWIDFT